jgi:curli biogenesis system outer membrane secretion channel CsgG
MENSLSHERIGSMRISTFPRSRLFDGMRWILIAFVGFVSPRFSAAQSRFTMQDSRVVAVLDFDQQGFISGDKIGGFAADELTTALFINRSLKVVDRALVRAATLQKNLSPSTMTAEDICGLASALKADLIVLGNITRLDSETTDPQGNGAIHAQLTIRILSAKDGSVIGMATDSISKKGELQAIIGKAVKEMAEDVRFDGD